MFFSDILQPTHILLILAVALLVLGPKRLPEAARSIGRGIHDFRGAISGEAEPTGGALDGEAAPARSRPAEPGA